MNGEDGLEKEIAAKIDAFQGLLTREAALRIIAKEKRTNIRGRVVSIFPPVFYPSGKISRSLLIEKESRKAALKLWGKELELFTKIKVGDEIEIKNAYEKNGELLLGNKGNIDIVSHAPFCRLSELPERSYVNVRGKISSIAGKRHYTKKDGFFFVFFLNDGSAEKQCIIWEEAGRGARLAIGDEVVLENAFSRDHSLHINSRSRILRLRNL